MEVEHLVNNALSLGPFGAVFVLIVYGLIKLYDKALKPGFEQVLAIVSKHHEAASTLKEAQELANESASIQESLVREQRAMLQEHSEVLDRFKEARLCRLDPKEGG